MGVLAAYRVCSGSRSERARKSPSKGTAEDPLTTREAARLQLSKLALRYRRPFIVLAHLAFVVVSNRWALLLRFDGAPPPEEVASHLQMLPWLIALRGMTFMVFRLYEGLWRYSGLWDLSQIIAAVGVSSAAFMVLVRSPLAPVGYPRSVVIIDALLLICILGGLRLSRRVYRAITRVRRDKHVLIFGAGDAGEMIVRDIKNNAYYGFEPIGFIDDDLSKVGRRIHGIPVLGTRDNLSEILAKYNVHEVLLAMPSVQPSVTRAVVSALTRFKVRITTLPNLRDLIEGKVALSEIHSLAVEDLLTRAPIGLDPQRIRRLISGRSVLVTGAGGSIGSELSRQILALAPERLLLLDRYENGLYAIANDLRDPGVAVPVETLVGDITDAGRVKAIMETYRPHIVFHAAAHKHVPLMELHPCEAVKNNVTGTRILAEAAEQYGVERFILVSTDKAVNPSSIMGATKRVGELLMQAMTNGNNTLFLTVRFGNVLGSNGSVVPRLLAQIEAGGPVTVTHPAVERYFMLIPEAVQLVLHAAAEGTSGGIYVLEMGEQIKLLDMARSVIRLTGHTPDEEIAIKFVGLRPGEKLSEELVWPDEDVRQSAVEKVLQANPRVPCDRRALFDNVRRLEELAAQQDETGTRSQLARMVPFVGSRRPVPDQATDAVIAPATSVEKARSTAREDLPEETSSTGREDLPPGQRCPACQLPRFYRSQARFPLERLRKAFTARRPFRCHSCGWRGWILAMEPAVTYTVPADSVERLDALNVPEDAIDLVAPEDFVVRSL